MHHFSSTEKITKTKAMGVVHVLTGPDHLSALATLSANVGNFRAFWYGVRWGIGHSTGLVLVGCFMIALSGTSEDEVRVLNAFSLFICVCLFVLTLILIWKGWMDRRVPVKMRPCVLPSPKEVVISYT